MFGLVRRKKRFFLLLFVVIVIIAIIVVMRKKPAIEYTTESAVKGDLTQTVVESGTLKPIKELNLDFLSAGKLASLLVKVNDQVSAGQVLAQLEQNDQLAKLQEVTANLAVHQAALQKLLTGASPAELTVSASQTEQAKAAFTAAQNELDKTKQLAQESLTQAQKNYYDLTVFGPETLTYDEQAVILAENTLTSKEETLLSVIENKQATATSALDAIVRVLNDDDAEKTLGIGNSNTIKATQDTHKAAGALLDIAKSDLAANKSANLVYNSTLTAVNKTFSALNNCFSLLEYTVTSSDLSQTELDALKTSITAQITNITTAITALQGAKQDVNAANENYLQAQANLNDVIKTAEQTLNKLKITNEQSIVLAESKLSAAKTAWQTASAELAKAKSPARSEDLALQRAQVAQANAQVDYNQLQLDHRTIKAPIDGVVIRIEYEVGEQTAPGSPVIALLADHNFVLELDIAETDISKIKLQDPAIISLDAYGDEIKFNGAVIFIEPAETEIQGVIYYKVKVNFDSGDYQIKSGMTATAEILTAKKTDVLMIPSRAVIEENPLTSSGQANKKMVRVLMGKTPQNFPVELGLQGDDGLVEVISGLKAGDRVVTYVKDNSAKK